eukprot:06237.XXX_17523_17797_1 [CDS] Oithona nana genome sequencing.
MGSPNPPKATTTPATVKSELLKAKKELMYYKIISKFPNLQRMLQITFDIHDIIQAFN